MKALITGGAGFIGCNTVKSLSEAGWQITILDNLSRAGSEKNLDWLRSQVSFDFVNADVRDAAKVADVIAGGAFDAAIHLAAQVAVTTSVVSPREDFEINALGTLNVLEGLRVHSPQTTLIYASTNKVYGQLSELKVEEDTQRYSCPSQPDGVTELQPLDFHSPYGCSKGSADQYVIDYARIYGMRCVAFRQSCIYGCRQFGVEDQGWVAWFTIAHVLGKPITIYGNGKQVRDVLFVEDLVAAYKCAIDSIGTASGKAYNIGGGSRYSLSLLELIDELERLSGRKVSYTFDDWRPGDQPLYVSDITRAHRELDWAPKIGAKEGVARLYEWISQNKTIFDV